MPKMIPLKIQKTGRLFRVTKPNGDLVGAFLTRGQAKQAVLNYTPEPDYADIAEQRAGDPDRHIERRQRAYERSLGRS